MRQLCVLVAERQVSERGETPTARHALGRERVRMACCAPLPAHGPRPMENKNPSCVPIVHILVCDSKCKTSCRNSIFSLPLPMERCSKLGGNVVMNPATTVTPADMPHADIGDTGKEDITPVAR